MRVPRVLLLQVRDREDPMRAHEVQCFERKLGGHGQFELVVHSLLLDGARGSPLHGVDAVMVGGSGRYGCVDNRSPWFAESLDLFRRVVDRGIPTFCSCWGHQALAVALGGQVVRDASRRELGTFDIRLTDQGLRDPLFEGFPQRFRAQLGHNDHVSQLPPEAVLLASSDRSPIQCYRLGKKPVYATQFHPELDHRENRERAEGYLDIYQAARTGVVFRESPLATELIPRFLNLYL